MKGHDLCSDFSDSEAEVKCCKGSEYNLQGWKVRVVVKLAVMVVQKRM